MGTFSCDYRVTVNMLPSISFIILLASTTIVAEQLDPKSNLKKRLIPADVLRDFRDSCFASTQCKTYKQNETWSLSPFCGESVCRKDAESGRLFEEVRDCGPLLDTKASKCTLVPTDKDLPFPKCCPVYDCEDVEQVVYLSPPKKTSGGRKATGPAKAPAPVKSETPAKDEN